MQPKNFKWNDQLPITFLRLETLGKFYGYSKHNDDEMVFKVVPIGGDQGSGNMLKALRIKHRWTQSEAGKVLGCSQTLIAKYENGALTMPLRVALKIQEQNADPKLDSSWHKYHIRERIFKWNRNCHIVSMRIEALGRLFGYYYHKDDEMVFKAAPKGWSPKIDTTLKEMRVKNNWTQAEAGEKLGFSQSLIAKYETGNLPIPQRLAGKIRLLNNGMTLDQIKEFELDLEKIRQQSQPPIR